MDALVRGAVGGLDGVTGLQVTEFPDGTPGTVPLDALTDQPTRSRWRYNCRTRSTSSAHGITSLADRGGWTSPPTSAA
jgi:hypothetical protein